MMSAPSRTELISSPRPRPSTQFEAVPNADRALPRLAVAAVLVAIFGIFGARCWPVARGDAITSDETTHLIRVLNLFQNGDDLAMWELGAPRLPHVMGGYASYLALRADGMMPASADMEKIARLVVSGMPRVVVPARCVAIGWGMLLIGLVFWAAARTRGAISGLIAAGLVSTVPECLAHSAIAGSDMPFTTSAFFSLICMARYIEKPTARRWALAALAVGLAWAMRHTALVLLILAAGIHLVVALRKPRAPGVAPLAEVLASSGLAIVAMGVISFTVLWAGDGFGTLTLGEVAGRASRGLPQRMGPIDVSRLQIPSSAVSVVKQVRHQNAGHEAFLCGEFGQSGWPSYFPIAFLLKTPTGLLMLFVLAVARMKLGRPSPWDAVAIAFLGLLWLMLVRNKVNIGVRYAVLTYPLAMPFVARMFEGRALRDRVWGPVVLISAGWFAVASIGAHGRYLSSFNEIGGGPKMGWMYLADSNIDWGQDFDALGRTIETLGIKEVTTDVSSERRLDLPGVFTVMNRSKATQVPAATPPNRRLYDDEGEYLPIYTRYVAVSVSRLHGLYSQNDVSWLRTRRLVSRVGDSIFLFDMDRPAERPFVE
ncbi:MAG: hypothetical protein JWN86_756 [Planctomycetota bacterium]|nr:hypothetical protein [Planctomycetota bacterium]